MTRRIKHQYLHLGANCEISGQSCYAGACGEGITLKKI